MPAGLLGKKVGMTQIFGDDGAAVAVTVVEAGPCVVVAHKTVDSDGYEAVQLGYEDVSYARANAPTIGHFESKGISPKKYQREFGVLEDEELEPGDELTVDIFEVGELVNIRGTSKGKGFAGVMKRHGMRGGPASHGSKVHRTPMSAGATDAQRVFPGQRMPGQMGNANVTTQNLEIVGIDHERNVLLIKGSVPGANGSLLKIEKAS
ncbi:MAG: 50S ribosomal protein L3 [Armatimonadota bacterium]